MPAPKADSTGRRNTSIRFSDTVALESLVVSIGSVGDAYDIAAAETDMELYKNEAVQKGPPFWSGPLKTLTDVEELTFDWVVWYNIERLHSALGNVPPEGYETHYYDEINVPSTGGAAKEQRHETGDGSHFSPH